MVSAVRAARTSHIRRLANTTPQSALFNFQSLLLVILLTICTCTYVRAAAPTLVDRNKKGYVRRRAPHRCKLTLPALWASFSRLRGSVRAAAALRAS